jgi:hypothetical protein
MKQDAECSDCIRWWSDYEAATMEEFRTHSRLQIARYSHDEQAIAQLRTEAEAVTKQRECLRAALLDHQKSHPPAKAA